VAFDAHDFRVALAKSLVDGAADHYNENTRINGVVDDKAQKVAGIAGVFLAAALAFIKIDNLSVWPFNRLRVMILLALSVAFIICCIAFCLRVLWVRAFPGLPAFAWLKELQSDLFHLPVSELKDQHEASYWNDRASIWQGILEEQDRAIAAKGTWLFRAQLALALAMLTVAALLMVIVGPIIHQRWSMLP
jgi:hypothetical protein